MTIRITFLLLLSLIAALSYLLIEVRSWILLFDSLTTFTDTDTLKERETFGYITVAIGVTVFVFQRTIKKARENNSIRSLLSFLVLSPIVYIVSYITIFSAIEHSAYLVSHDQRPLALKASLVSLTSPEKSGVAPFYLNRSYINEVDDDYLIKQYIALFATSDKDILKAFSGGVDLAVTLNNMYHSQIDKLKKHGFDEHSASNRAYHLFVNEFDYTYHQRIQMVTSYSSMMLFPFYYLDYMVFLAPKAHSIDDLYVHLKHVLTINQNHIKSTPFSAQLLSDAYSCTVSFSSPCVSLKDAHRISYYSTNKQLDKIRFLISQFGFTYSEALRFDLTLSYEELYLAGLTNSLFSKLNDSDLNIPSLPKRKLSNPLESETLKFVMRNQAPFMLRADQYIFSSNRLNDRSYIARARSFAAHAPERARKVWESYQYQQLSDLMHQTNSWRTDWVTKAYLPLLRFSVVLPLMLLVSSIFILINLIFTIMVFKAFLCRKKI